MQPVPPVSVPLQANLLGEQAVQGLEVGSVLKHVKLMLDTDCAASGVIKFKDVVADLGYADLWE